MPLPSFGYNLDGFTDRVIQALSRAEKLAWENHHRSITPEHLLLALTQVRPGPGLITLERLGVSLSEQHDAAALVTVIRANGKNLFGRS